MVVLDEMIRDPAATAYLHWVSDDVPVTLDADNLRLTTADSEGNVLIQVCPISADEVAAVVHRGQTDPHLGWVKAAGGPAPAPLLQVAMRSTSPTAVPVASRCATVIVPFDGADRPELTASAGQLDRLTAQVTLDWADGARDRVIYTSQLDHAIRRCGAICTDAPLVIISTPAGGGSETIDHVGGTFVRATDRHV